MDLDAFVAALPARYADAAVLSRGERGAVLRVRDTLLRRRVVLKALACAGGLDETLRARFHREAGVLAGLDHPGIVRIHDIQTEPCPWMVMAHVDGEPLCVLIEREGPLAPARALAIAAGVAEALAAAHDAGVVHRKLDPGNVLVGEEDAVTLLDFGFASLAPAEEATLGGPVLARLEYAAPEVVREEPPSASSDLYSLGVLLYEMLTARRPLPATRVLARDFASRRTLRDRRPDLDPRLDALVMRVLAVDPAERPAGAAALLGELARLRETLTGEPEGLLEFLQGVRDVLHPLKNRLALVRRHAARPERALELLARPAVRDETARTLRAGEEVLAEVREAPGELGVRVRAAIPALAGAREALAASAGPALLEGLDGGFAALHRVVEEAGRIERAGVFAPGEVARGCVARARGEGLAARVRVEPGLERPRSVPDPRGARAALEGALEELLVNARGAGATQAAVEVDLDEGALRVRVRDDGPGLPEPDPEAVFTPGYTAGKEEGTGRGLADARARVEALGGTLRALPGRRTGAAFELRLPAGRPVEGGRK